MTDNSIDIEAVRNGDVKKLCNADLWGADLRRADLEGADLSDAYLWNAHLSGANLSDADLEGANLCNADLWGADLPRYERLPEAEDFVAYKGCKNHVVKLRVPADADRTSSLVGPKCRAEYVEVVEVLDEDGNECGDEEAVSWYDCSAVYREGERVEPDDWDADIRVECTNGIHIYPTLDEAKEAVK